MLLFTLILPLIAGTACLALNRTVASRWLGLAAAASLLVPALVLGAARTGGLPLVLADRDWLVLGEQTVRLSVRLDGLSWMLAVLALFGGALALCALALALPRELRGFGGLLAALLLAPLATAAGLALAEPLLLPFPWAITTLAAFVALRASGALADADTPLLVLAAGVGGALVAFAAALLVRVTPPDTSSIAALLCIAFVAALGFGAPPLHAPLAAAVAAPAALAAVVVALGTPLLGGYALLSYTAALGPAAPPAWGVALTVFGALALVAGAAGALGTTHMRAIVGWQVCAQAGALFVAAGASPSALAAAPALLANTVLTSLAALLAIAALEQRTGSDDLTALGARGPFPIPGMAMLLAAASAAGFPGTLGFWGRLWLADALGVSTPWALALLLTGSALLALSYVAPVAAFWRRDPQTEPMPALSRMRDLPALAAVLPLLVAGAAPGALWNLWLADAARVLAPGASVATPALPGVPGSVATIAAAVCLVALPLIARRGQQRRADHDREAQSEGVMPPGALGQSMAGLAWVAQPRALGQIWKAVVRASDLLNEVLGLFERRYYLAGLVLAMIVVLLVFI